MKHFMRQIFADDPDTIYFEETYQRQRPQIVIESEGKKRVSIFVNDGFGAAAITLTRKQFINLLWSLRKLLK